MEGQVFSAKTSAGVDWGHARYWNKKNIPWPLVDMVFNWPWIPPTDFEFAKKSEVLRETRPSIKKQSGFISKRF